MPGSEGQVPVAELSYTEASAELDDIVAFFEQREVDVDQLVTRLERATAIVDELDRRLRRTRTQVEELVPRLRAVGGERVAVDQGDGPTNEDLDEEELEVIVVEFEEAETPQDPTDLRPSNGENPGLF
jgi:exodeoxyribonuclease VII small subunit